ncbi:hypothetical protein GN958_ATG16078 [Phytophthora infestans]|uniref:Uncharacterized protein n=1 Tax=Phytophthora infestans TaxID=4787 RepID=A0A8S9U590_PHYIN|nr:hypothetical protein GN958_ATG16078 [Phytophthora infestans]
MTTTLDPPAAVKRADESWADIGPFKRKPIQPGESSIIFDLGVRVEYTEGTKTKVGYICLADEYCRRTDTADNLLLLSRGNTSAAVKHLRLVHHLVSPKPKRAMTTKRKREEEIEHLRSSVLFSRNPARLNLLLETLRIVSHNLPLRIGEYEASRLKEAVVVRDEMQVVITVELIEESIIELYVSTTKEVIEFLHSNRQLFPYFTMVADFWTCKTMGEQYLGLRVYLIDTNWHFWSVLLGTRKFNPAYGDRDGGIRRPFLLWVKRTLEDFQLTVKDLYGATSDKGSDVVGLLTEELDLEWE